MVTHNLIIATDLDGTLLDHHHYQSSDAQAALELIKQHHIPLILNTSKTLSEVNEIRHELQNEHPFIVENGAGVFIPVDYFPELNKSVFGEQDGLLFKTFGTLLNQIKVQLTHLRTAYGFKFRGFSDMSLDEIVQHTGLNKHQAAQAKNRLFTEPIIWLDNDQQWQEFHNHMDSLDLQVLRGGRFIHISGAGNKGTALQWLKSCYASNWLSTPVLIAAGDSQNDLAMLEIADFAVVVTSPTHPSLSLPNHHNVTVTEHHGPKGWNIAMINLINQHLEFKRKQSINKE